MAASFLLGCFLAVPAAAQQPTTIQGWSELISRLEDEIKGNEELLKKITGDKKTTQQELRLVRNRIDTRRKMLNSLEQKIKLLENDITTKNRAITQLVRENEKLKKEYGDMVYAAYKNHKLNNSMAFLFASNDFNDATRRIDYMRRYNKMREEKAAAIDSLSGIRAVELAELNKQLDQLDNSRKTSAREIDALKKDETAYNTKSASLAKEESKVSGTIKKKEEEKKKAQAQLKKITEEAARKNAAKNRSQAELAAMAALSSEFENNRGKLPWPLPGGAVSDRFGSHAHPTQKNLKIENNGINIAGEKGAKVRCVFNGEVAQVVFIMGMNNCVLVNHGDYYTVYANLATVNVKAGDKVSTAQNIGAIPATDDSNDHFLHFEICRDRQYYDPEKWLFK